MSLILAHLYERLIRRNALRLLTPLYLHRVLNGLRLTSYRPQNVWRERRYLQCAYG